MKRRELMKAGMFGAASAGIAALTACSRPTAEDCLARDITEVKPNPTAIRKGYVDGPFGQIHYYQTGTGPALILAHQSPTCARMFESAMPLLGKRGLRVIAVDTPGFGNSDIPASPPSVADYADAFPAVLDGLGLEQAHFLGHHTGAGILCNFAVRYPGRVSSLILNGPPLFTAEDLEPYKDITPSPHPIHRDGSHLQEAWDRRARFTPGWTDEKVMHRRLVDHLWAGDTAWYGHNAAFKYDMKPDLMALKGRVLIFSNTGDDSYRYAKNAHALRQDFAFEELVGGTHDIVDEQPEAWSEVVANFVLNA